MATSDAQSDPWWKRIATTCAYLVALAALITVATTGVDPDAITDGPIVEAVRSLSP